MSIENSEFPDEIKTLLDGSDYAGPASEGAVGELEDKLGFNVPAQYRVFLLSYGAALLHGFEIYGLADTEDGEPPTWSDVRNELRPTELGGLLNRLIPISDDGGDYTFYIASTQDDESLGEPVVAYGPGVDGKEVAVSFFDFIAIAQRDGVATLLR
ncbi:hypothetical protein A3197_17415 [Candidatus Thiodiazotropha endoloripes]|nr:hypothetical protein A3197_17415 [Candidatus Thiodiazotropha endoloripes]